MVHKYPSKDTTSFCIPLWTKALESPKHRRTFITHNKEPKKCFPTSVFKCSLSLCGHHNHLQLILSQTCFVAMLWLFFISWGPTKILKNCAFMFSVIKSWRQKFIWGWKASGKLINRKLIYFFFTSIVFVSTWHDRSASKVSYKIIFHIYR